MSKDALGSHPMRPAEGSLLRSYKQPNIFLNLDGRGLSLLGGALKCE